MRHMHAHGLQGTRCEVRRAQRVLSVLALGMGLCLSGQAGHVAGAAALRILAVGACMGSSIYRVSSNLFGLSHIACTRHVAWSTFVAQLVNA